jgi:hypothetical protein
MTWIAVAIVLAGFWVAMGIILAVDSLIRTLINGITIRVELKR